jgi:hypothetical protein
VEIIRLGTGMRLDGKDGIEERLGGWWQPPRRIVDGTGGSGGSGGSGGNGILLDPDDAFARAGITWADILEPIGWRRECRGVEGWSGSGAEGWSGSGGGSGEQEVWIRPGGDSRSAVVYSDAPGVLVVFSDAPEAGGAWWNGRGGDGRMSRTWTRLRGTAWPLDVQRQLQEDARIVDRWLAGRMESRGRALADWYEQNREWLG